MIKHKETWAPQPWTTRGRRTPLSYDPQSDRIAYASGKTVVVRAVANPAEAVLYSEHLHPVTAVAFAPSGHYIASGDSSGQVRIWSTTGDEIITKGTYPAIGGKVQDVAWDFESKRIIAVGDGKERYGHAFSWDSGNSVGEISGHAAEINAVAIRPSRPLRAVTAGEDAKVVFNHGAPFKFEKTVLKHTSAVSDVAYSPDGAHFVTVGCDRKVGVYDGKTGDWIEWLDIPHEGSILAVAWVNDSVVSTAGTDCTVRLFDITNKTPLAVYELPKSTENQQTGLAATKDYVISVPLSGDLLYWSTDGKEKKPLRVVQGHQRAVTGIVLDKHVYTSSVDGSVLVWQDNLGKRLDGHHEGPVVDLILGATVVSAGWDKTFKKIPGFETVAKVKEQPISVAGNDKLLASVSEELLEVVDGKDLRVDRGHAVDVHKSDVLALGAGYVVSLYSVTALTQTHKFDPLTSEISVVKFSPDGAYLAAGTTAGKIILYSVVEKKVITSRWAFHTSRVTSIAWHPDGQRIVSCSSDTHVCVYSVKTPGKSVQMLNAHREGVTRVAWLDDSTIISGGADASIKIWLLESAA